MWHWWSLWPVCWCLCLWACLCHECVNVNMYVCVSQYVCVCVCVFWCVPANLSVCECVYVYMLFGSAGSVSTAAVDGWCVILIPICISPGWSRALGYRKPQQRVGRSAFFSLIIPPCQWRINSAVTDESFSFFYIVRPGEYGAAFSIVFVRMEQNLCGWTL